MKIPYIKIPIADVSAYLAGFDFETKGKIFQAVLNYGLYQKWDMLELDETGCRGYANVQEIVENETKSYKKFCKDQKQKAKKLWDKKQKHDEAVAMPDTKATKCQTETKTETEYINKKPTAVPKTADAPKPVKPKKLNDLQNFSNAVIENFEPDLKTDQEKAIWFKRNCRCLSDILNFCGKDIRLGIATIDACLERMEKLHLQGVGYEAVCRNLPFYREEAKKKAGGVYA